MKQLLLQPIYIALLVLPLLFFVHYIRKGRHFGYTFVALLFLLTIGPVFYLGKTYLPLPSDFQLPWGGKIADAAVAFLILIFSSKHFKNESGFHFKIERKDLKSIVGMTGFTILFLAIMFLRGAHTNTNLENYIFQLTIAGIAEELAHRGIILALFNRIFPKSFELFGGKFGWGLIFTSLIFGLLHGLIINTDYTFYLNLQNIFITAVVGFSLGWLKEKTGSLLLPILFHNLYNFLFALGSKLFFG